MRSTRSVIVSAVAVTLVITLAGPAGADSESGTLACGSPVKTSSMTSRVSGDNTLRPPGDSTYGPWHNGSILIKRKQWAHAPGIGGVYNATTNDIMDHAQTYPLCETTGA